MGTFRNIHIILNPGSGPDDGHVDDVRAACEASGRHVLHVLEEGKAIGDVVRDAAGDGADLVVAAGGDGTVRSVAEAVLKLDLPMGIVPAGSANVFATDLGIPPDPEDALEVFERPSPTIRSVDVGRVNDILFLVRFGLGWHAEMTVHAPGQMKAFMGRWAYAYNAMRIRFRQKRVSYTIVSDGKERKERGVCCIVANTANLGIGNWRVSEDVDLSSGRLQVYVIRRASWLSVSRLLFRAALPATLHGGHGPRRGPGDVVEWPARRVRIESRPEQVAAMDGEVYDGGLPADVTVDPGALRIVVP